MNTKECSICGVRITDPAGWTGDLWFCEDCAITADFARPVFETPAEHADIEALIDSLCDGGAR